MMYLPPGRLDIFMGVKLDPWRRNESINNNYNYKCHVAMILSHAYPSFLAPLYSGVKVKPKMVEEYTQMIHLSNIKHES